MGSSIVVETNDLRKTYREGVLGKRDVHALNGVSLEIRRGEVFGLLGPNGAGKTTLIKILLGIVRRSSGSASVLGFPVGSQSSRQRIGYLPENLHVARHHTARTALRYFGALSRLDNETVRRRTDELLSLVGLANRSRESVRRFSKGMGQRLGLAQALLNDPDLLILDEPTDGLDPVGRSQVRDIIDELKGQGKTIFVNSHILQEVELICDRVAILAQGHVKGVGTIDELRGDGSSRFTIETINLTADAQQQLEQQWAIHVSANGSSGNVINIDGDDQSKVDAAVDLIRNCGASIVRMNQHRTTLEDAFLRLVESSHAETS